jgi:hypothetical protein
VENAVVSPSPAGEGAPAIAERKVGGRLGGLLRAGEREAASAVAVVAALTVIGFVLRYVGIDESLFADEIYTHRIITGNDGPLDVIDEVHDTAITPPLHYLLGWFAAQLGEPSVWIRVPSLVLGTATVPVTYLLGLRTVGKRAALVGAAFASITPFALFYGTEARAYATLMFLVALSTLALVSALETRSRRWLVVYGICACLVLYAHYSGVFVVLAQAAWALWTHRDRLLELAIVHAAIAVGYLAWVPSFFFQSEEHPPVQISLVSPVTLDSFVKAVLAVFPGGPRVGTRVVPGREAMIVLAVALAGALAAVAWRLVRRRSEGARPRPSAEVWLLALLAVATPLGITLYSLLETSLFGPRNLAASLPAVWLVLGRLLTAPRGLLALAAVTLTLGAVAVGTAKSLDPDYRRPPFRDAARFIDERARPGAPVVEVLWLSPANALSLALGPHFERPHELLRVGRLEQDPWRRAALAGRVFVVVPQVEGLRGVAWGDRLGERFSLEARAVYRGVIPVAVLEYRGAGGPAARLARRDGHEVVVRPEGVVPVERRVGGSYVDRVNRDGAELTILGWALDAEMRRPARLLVAFDRGRLVAAARTSLDRPDIAEKFGRRYLSTGFELKMVRDDAEALAQPGRLRIFAVSSEAAWEVPAPAASFDAAR